MTETNEEIMNTKELTDRSIKITITIISRMFKEVEENTGMMRSGSILPPALLKYD